MLLVVVVIEVTLLLLAGAVGGIALFDSGSRAWGAVITGVCGALTAFVGDTLFRLGRYRLTTQQLEWTPFRGATRVIALHEISREEIDVDLSLLQSVLLLNHRVRMPLVKNGLELWGDLILFSEIAKLPPDDGRGPTPAFVQGQGTIGKSLKKIGGHIVAYRDQVAFIPNRFQTKPLRPIVRAGAAAGAIALAAVGVVNVPVSAIPNVTQALSIIATFPGKSFDTAIVRLVALMGGTAAGRSAIRIEPAVAGKAALWIGDVEVTIPSDLGEQLQQFLRASA